MVPHILIVEDDNEISNLLAELLRRAGYTVTQAFSGTEASLRLEGGGFDLLLLDRMLPGLPGEEVLAALRKTSSLPVIVLSARESAREKAELLRLGADDYITKPFNEDELLARIEAALRRAGAAAPAARVYSHRHLTLDADARTVHVHGAAVKLTAHEFDILALLMQNPAKVFTKANLYTSVWNDKFMGDENTVNVHISNLRAKLGAPEAIQTVWGIGFKMAE